MPRRRKKLGIFRNVPGAGLTRVPAAEFYDDILPADIDLLPEARRRRILRAARSYDVQRRVMNTAWQLLRSGQARNMREAMTMAWRKIGF